METSSNAQPVIEGTNVRKFLAQKGSIVIKELREVLLVPKLLLQSH
ncbi:MAG: hypothetical protein WCI11_03015 [Candidatus Methylumidiphilus sp.]